MVSATVGGVIGTGLALGIVHVLTGPDHLSALATLSVGKTWRSAFGLGVRWGCGHSFGLLIVAIIFFAVGQSVNIDTLTYWADLFVGIFMIVLGVWYIGKAYKDKENIENENALYEEAQLIKETNENNNNNSNIPIAMETIDIELETTTTTRKNIDNNKTYQSDLQDEINSNSNKIEINNDNNNNNNNKNETNYSEIDNTDEDGSNHSETVNSNTSSDTTTTTSSSNGSSNSSNNSDSHESGEIMDKNTNINNNNNNEDNNDVNVGGGGDALLGTLAGNLSNALSNVIMDGDDENDIEMDASLGYNEDSQRSKCMTRVVAFVAGIFHGIAGPGGVLGVMVALKLNSWIYSSLYMFVFFLSSICTMGVYAIVYGFATSRMTLFANNKQLCAFYLKLVSALFSIIVGVLWLTLTFTGTLDKIFD